MGRRARRRARRRDALAAGLARRLADGGGARVTADGPGSGGAPWGRLEAGLADKRVRDGVLVALVPGTRDLPERCVGGRARRPSSMPRSGSRCP